MLYCKVNSSKQVRQQSKLCFLLFSPLAIQHLTEDNVEAFLNKIGLHNYSKTFKDNKIDGNMLEAIIHPTLGEGLMKSLGIVEENDRTCLEKSTKLSSRDIKIKQTLTSTVVSHTHMRILFSSMLSWISDLMQSQNSVLDTSHIYPHEIVTTFWLCQKQFQLDSDLVNMVYTWKLFID